MSTSASGFSHGLIASHGIVFGSLSFVVGTWAAAGLAGVILSDSVSMRVAVGVRCLEGNSVTTWATVVVGLTEDRSLGVVGAVVVELICPSNSIVRIVIIITVVDVVVAVGKVVDLIL